MENNIDLRAESRLGNALQSWWKGLDDDRATRAMLRRCSTLDEISLSPAYQRFYRYMLACGWPEDAEDWQRDKLAAIAGLVAWVKVDNGQSLPYQMSELDGDRPLLSELRFRALLKLDHTDELYAGLRRALPVIGHHVGVVQMARDIYGWSDQTKKHWAYTYRWQPAKQSS